MGSKNRIAKHILPIMLKDRGDRWWVEPFVGGGNIIDKVVGYRRIGSDINRYCIEALQSVKSYLHELPKNNNEFTEEDYKKLRVDDLYKHKGFAGFAYSYGGKWMGGWARDKDGKRDYVAESYRNAEKQSPKLKGSILVNHSYENLYIPTNSIIYCDIEYRGTTKYSNKQKFDYDKFYDWCRLKCREGHSVFISEYNMPEDFRCIWAKEVNNTLVKDTGSKKGIERLFTL